jgi:hypothetical protein
LEAASKAGDLQGALHRAAQPFHDLMLSFILAEEADDVLRAALNEKFGLERRKGFRMEVKQDLLRIRSLKVLAKEAVSETRVKFTVRETVRSFQRDGDDIADVQYLVVKDGASWKVLRPFTALVFGASQEEYTKATEKGVDGKEITVFKIKFNKELDELGRYWVKRLEEDEKKKLSEVLAERKRAKTVAERVAADVKRGKYKTRKEAMEAYEVAVRAPK